VPNPGRQGCGGIVIYIWCGRNATVSLIKFLGLLVSYAFLTGVNNPYVILILYVMV
jgi:hypothetical protein